MNKFMKMPNREKSIKKDVVHRQAMKKKWDRHCKYSSDDEMKAAIEAGEALEFTIKAEYAAKDGDENWIRLLDEGVVVDGGDWVYAVIEKGVIKRFFDELPNNFEGYIDKDHIPAIYLGKYSKSDLKLVELADDRYGIDVNIKLDKTLFAVQDLLKEKGHNAVSVEMFTKVREYATVSKITGMSEDEAREKYGWDYLVPIIEDLAIPGFAICKAPKNANSYKDGLLEQASVSEGEEMTKEEKERLAQLQAEEEKKEELAEDNTAKAEENGSDVQEENVPDCNAEAENKAEEEKVEAQAEQEEPDTSAGAEEISDEQFEEVKNAIAELKAQIEEKDAKIAELEAQLSEKKESEKSAKMSTSDRIAELLNFAKEAKPVQGETNASNYSTSKESRAKEIEDFYRQGFAENN